MNKQFWVCGWHRFVWLGSNIKLEIFPNVSDCHSLCTCCLMKAIKLSRVFLWDQHLVIRIYHPSPFFFLGSNLPEYTGSNLILIILLVISIFGNSLSINIKFEMGKCLQRCQVLNLLRYFIRWLLSGTVGMPCLGPIVFVVWNWAKKMCGINRKSHMH